MAIATVPQRLSRRPHVQALQITTAHLEASRALAFSKAELRDAEDHVDRVRVGVVRTLIDVATQIDAGKSDPKDRIGIGKTESDKARNIEEALTYSDDYQAAVQRLRLAQVRVELDNADVTSHGNVLSAIRVGSRERLTASLRLAGLSALDLS
jgi:hypothetical protein